MSSITRPAVATRALALGAAAAILLLRLSGCVPIPEEDDDIMIPPMVLSPTPVPAPTIAALTDFAIVDMRREPGSDPSLVRIVGTIVNNSKEPASHVLVRIEGRDILGRALTRVTVPALVEPIAASGGTSSFEASLPESTAIHDYHAEVVAR
jgi:hypothetical protein